MKSLEVLKSILGKFYKHHPYIKATQLLRDTLRSNEYYRNNWESVKQLISSRKLEEGTPLSLMDVDANLPLDENSDMEAYKWLDLMIQNAQSEGQIKEY